ncbi:MAG: hypothetical protein M1814_002640 [Vezdaea aestivalis]|nr:MAG: hypothetical protein M1814_002640 [Vezdaea aestivalis]
MYFDLVATDKYLQGLVPLSNHASSLGVDLFVIPDFLSLRTAQTILGEHPIYLGAQDAFWEDAGPYTGEISPLHLQQACVTFVELGHAERRRLFGETDEQVARKAAAVCRNGLTPLVCIGERTKGEIDAAVAECQPQLEAVLRATEGCGQLVLAYEPVWAIGKSEPAAPEYVVAVTQRLRDLCGSRGVRILYGGSAGPGLFEKLRSGVDGLFLGRFAHDLTALKAIISEVAI